MTDTVDTVIELPVGAIAPTASPSSHWSCCRPTAPPPTAPSPATAGEQPLSSRAPSSHPRSTTVTRCLDATERLRHQPTDRQQAQRLTAA